MRYIAIAAAAFLAVAGAASAEDQRGTGEGLQVATGPVALSEAQLDGVTAGGYKDHKNHGVYPNKPRDKKYGKRPNGNDKVGKRPNGNGNNDKVVKKVFKKVIFKNGIKIKVYKVVTVVRNVKTVKTVKLYPWGKKVVSVARTVIRKNHANNNKPPKYGKYGKNGKYAKYWKNGKHAKRMAAAK